MRRVQYIHARPHAVDWLLAKHDHALGDVFHSVWCRQLIDAEPSVWEIRLNGGQELPAHLFQLQTVQYFTAGSISIGGERDCTEGDIRWADGNVASGSWKVASLGARFYLIGMDGTLQAAARQMADVKKIERWQCHNPCELEWAETVDHKHLSPPGRLCALCSGGPSVALLIFDPHCLAKPHSHPGNIIYIVHDGQMTIPGEGVYEQGDVRWAAKDHAYGPEVMGAKGSTLIAIQKDVPLAANWTNGSEDASA